MMIGARREFRFVVSYRNRSSVVWVMNVEEFEEHLAPPP